MLLFYSESPDQGIIYTFISFHRIACGIFSNMNSEEKEIPYIEIFLYVFAGDVDFCLIIFKIRSR